MDQAIRELCARITERFGTGPEVAAGVLGVSIVIGLLLHYVVLRGLARDPAEAYFRSVSALVPEEVDELLSPDVGRGVDPFRESQRPPIHR